MPGGDDSPGDQAGGGAGPPLPGLAGHPDQGPPAHPPHQGKPGVSPHLLLLRIEESRALTEDYCAFNIDF